MSNIDAINRNGTLDAQQVDIDISPPVPPTHQGSEHFFDMLTRLQGRRMNDQRAEMRGDNYDELPEFLRPRIDPPLDGDMEQAAAPMPAVDNDTEEHHEKMNNMISMLARSQSKRLNEQRVSLSTLPGLRINGEGVDNGGHNLPGPSNGVDHSDRNNNAQENQPRMLDDNFFDNLMRCQGTRLNDQRTSAPSGELPIYPTPTIPDEDFMSLIVRLQSSRIDDQRCRFEPESSGPQ
uniref:Uncharacterized protein n=1 Tax=Ciona savignyi TaxID=51511 RepID=H2YK72_CIOSA